MSYHQREPDPTDVLLSSLLRSEPYGRKSELGMIVERRVKELATDIANEVVNARIDLHDRVEEMVSSAVQSLLDSSDTLQRIINEAVVTAVLAPRIQE